MSDLQQWLTGLGLERFAEAFEREEVTLDSLPDLSEADLKDLGLPLGPRKTILRAASGLRATQNTSTTQPEARAQDKTAPPSPEAQAERRQLTVMFCDLVGSTALSYKLDPEALRELMRAYQQACRTVIEKYNGHIAQYLGDGLMTYFGWPRAHEDDAERAIRAGLEIVDVVKHVKAPEPLRVRIGIATGTVVVGETGAGDASVPKLAVGETPNLAARLQGLAGADEIVIAPTTHRLVGGVFECVDLGNHSLKGVVEAVRAFQVAGIGRSEGRFEASRGAHLTPLMGRDSELAMLLARWQQAKDGEGQVVLLSGEPGIGKSRITQALRERMAGEAYTPMRYQCSPFHTNSALHAVIEQLQRAAGFGRDDSVEQKLTKLETLLHEGAADLTVAAPLIAALLSLSIDRYPPLNLSPEKQREKTLESLINQLIGLSRARPLLMIVEDIHWIDPTFQELLNLTLPRIAQARVLMVLTHRPEYVPQWSGQHHVTTLALNRLGRRPGSALIAELTGGKALPAEVLEQILAKTDGVPLFVEELTKTVLEAGFLRDAGDRYELTGPLPPLAIPSTLQDSLTARLDRLATVKEVAQVAACIGRLFSYDFLAAVSPLSDAALRDALRQLAESGLIFAQGSPPEASYTFKHALVQDAAYDSLLKSRRAELHARIAATLKSAFSEIAATQPEIVAHHYTQAGLTRQAIGYWHIAGQRASQRLAYTEAIAYFQRGIDLAGTLPEGADAAALELGLQIGVGYAFIPTKGWTAPESLRAFTRAEALSVHVADDAALFSALWGLFVFNLVSAETVAAHDYANRCLALAERARSSDMLVEAHLARGMSAQRGGQFGPARADLEASAALYDPVTHRSHAFIYGQDPKVIGLSWLAVTVLLLGYPDSALARCADTKAAANEILHPVTQGFPLNCSGLTHLFRGEPEAAQRDADALIALGMEQGLPLWAGIGTLFRCAALIDQGRGSDRELAQMREVIATMRAVGATEMVLRMQTLLVQAYLQLGNASAARVAGEEGLALTRHHAQGEFEADYLNLLGDACVAGPAEDAAEAEHFYTEAIEVARRQEAKSLELRAAIGLARLWAQQGQGRVALDLLRPLYSWFTEGFDTKDLREARALLEELAG